MDLKKDRKISLNQSVFLSRNFKVCVIGGKSTGKSTLVKNFLKGEWRSTSPQSAIEESYFKKFGIGRNQVTFHILDTAGLNVIEKHFIEKWFDWADAFILIYSIVSYSSFETIKDRNIIQLLQKKNKPPPVILVGTKTDLLNKREVNENEASQLAKELDASLFEINQNSGTIEAIFQELATKLLSQNNLLVENKLKRSSSLTTIRRENKSNSSAPKQIPNWRNFFSHEVMPQLTREWNKPRKKKIMEPVFGLALEELIKYNKSESKIPDLLNNFLSYLSETDSLTSEGLFRINGNDKCVQQLKKELDKGNEIDFFKYKDCDCHVVCTLLKKWLSQLPEPLLTFELYEEFILISEKMDAGKIMVLMSRLPETNKIVFSYLIQFLKKVQSYSDKNKMNGYNLATVFGPCILYPKDRGDPIKQASEMSHVADILNFIIESESIMLSLPQEALSASPTQNHFSPLNQEASPPRELYISSPLPTVTPSTRPKNNSYKSIVHSSPPKSTSFTNSGVTSPKSRMKTPSPSSTLHLPTFQILRNSSSSILDSTSSSNENFTPNISPPLSPESEIASLGRSDSSSNLSLSKDSLSSSPIKQKRKNSLFSLGISKPNQEKKEKRNKKEKKEKKEKNNEELVISSPLANNLDSPLTSNAPLHSSSVSTSTETRHPIGRLERSMTFHL